VERTFGILANKWRIFHTPIDVKSDFCDNTIRACCILHKCTEKWLHSVRWHFVWMSSGKCTACWNKGQC